MTPTFARLRHPRAGLLVLAPAVAAACAPPPPPPPDPAIDADRAALVAESATRLDAPRRIVFEWTLSDRDMRASGRGVARVEPPYRARLDLFLDNGEAVLTAALVDHDLRLPPGAPAGIVPPAPLLWGALGVFRPGQAALFGADEPSEGRVRLRYGYPDGSRLHYTLAGPRIVQVELLREGTVTQRVVVEPGVDGAVPREALYRDLGAFRELRIRTESAEQVESYPPDVWDVR